MCAEKSSGKLQMYLRLAWGRLRVDMGSGSLEGFFRRLYELPASISGKPKSMDPVSGFRNVLYTLYGGL